MAAELRKSPRPGNAFDPSLLGPPPTPPPAVPLDGATRDDPRSPSTPASPKPSWGVKPTAQRVVPTGGISKTTSDSASPVPLSASQPIPLPSDVRKDTTGAIATQLSQSQKSPAVAPSTPSGAGIRTPYGPDEKLMRSPSVPVISPLGAPDDAARPRATMPTKLLPPLPPGARESARASAMDPNRPTSASASVVLASSSSSNPTIQSSHLHAPAAAQPASEERLSSGSLRSLEMCATLKLPVLTLRSAGDTPDTEQNILCEGRTLRAATPAKIIEKLSNPGYDPAFTLDCILTYPLFCVSANEFLDALVLRYQNVQNVNCRRKILNEVIRVWIEANFDWSIEPNLRAFLATVRTARNADSSLVPELFDLLDRMARRMREGYNTFSSLPPELKPLKPLMKDIHPKEMARQITLLASDIYKKIRVSELTKQAWSKKEKEKNAPNVLHLITRFNKTSLWVASMCVLPETVPARASTISYFIKVAKEMREIRNFDGMISIINGLENSSVLRLKQSWAFVEGKADLQAVKEMMTFDGNYKAYREHLASLDASEPAVPFIAPFLGDLTFIDENPNQINGLWNFGKCRMISKSIQVALKFQKVDYPFETVPMVQKYLAKIKLPQEQDIYDVSIKREKKGEEDKAASIMVETLFS